MGKKRVHELAKEFGLENREAVLLLQQGGVDVKTHSSSVYEDEARAVLMKARGKAAPQAPTAMAAEPTPSASGPGAPKRTGMMVIKKKTAEELSASAPMSQTPVMAEAAPQPEPEQVEEAPQEIHVEPQHEEAPAVEVAVAPKPEPQRDERTPAPAPMQPQAPAIPRHDPVQAAQTQPPREGVQRHGTQQRTDSRQPYRRDPNRDLSPREAAEERERRGGPATRRQRRSSAARWRADDRAASPGGNAPGLGASRAHDRSRQAPRAHSVASFGWRPWWPAPRWWRLRPAPARLGSSCPGRSRWPRRRSGSPLRRSDRAARRHRSVRSRP